MPSPWQWLGFAVQAAGIAVTAAGSRVLDVLDLAASGRSCRRDAAPRLPTCPCRPGLYGFVRHPIYFGWLLFVFGAPHMTMTRLVFALTSSAYLALAIPWEERGLLRSSGLTIGGTSSGCAGACFHSCTDADTPNKTPLASSVHLFKSRSV